MRRGRLRVTLGARDSFRPVTVFCQVLIVTREKIPAAREKKPLVPRVTTSTRFPQYWVLLTREPASFWQENVVALPFYYKF